MPRETAQRPERLLQVRDGLAVGGLAHRPEPRLTEIGDRLLPQLAPEGMVGEPLDLLAEANSVQPLDGTDELSVKDPAALLQQAAVGDLVA